MTGFELERAVDREELAALFETLAAAARGDRPARIDGTDATLSIEFPARTVLSLDLEREGGTAAAAVELELELEWDDPAEDPGVRVSEGERGEQDPAAAESDRGDAGRADEEVADRPSRRSRFEVYRDRAGEWRWRLVHWNGNVLADGGEGYASRYNAVRALHGVMRIAPEARIERLDP